MKGAMWIALVTVVIGVVLYISELRHRRRESGRIKQGEASASGSDRTDLSEGAGQSGLSDLSGQNDVSGQSDLSGRSDESDESDGSDQSECCGLHLVCEKDSLSPMSDEVVYYDDEELDRFVGRAADSYSAEETEEFRDVLMTLLPEDVAGWARSITQRRLELPPEVRDELLILVNEQRALAR